MAVTLGLLAAAAPPLLAHHSFAAEYDANQPVKVSGVVTQWTGRTPAPSAPATLLAVKPLLDRLEVRLDPEHW